MSDVALHPGGAEDTKFWADQSRFWALGPRFWADGVESSPGRGFHVLGSGFSVKGLESRGEDEA